MLKDFGYGQNELHAFVKSFQVQGGAAKGFQGDIFDTRRHAVHVKDKTLKASAGECMTVMPMLACLMEEALAAASAALVRHAALYLQLVQIIELVWAAHKHDVDCTLLRLCIEKYMQRFKEMFGASSMTPKFHFMFHLPDLIERFGWAPNCFALERKHKVPKRFANQIFAVVSTFDHSVLRECTCHHLDQLQGDSKHFAACASLIKPHKAKRAMVEVLQHLYHGHANLEILTAHMARVNQWEKVAVKDFVLFQVDGDPEGIKLGRILWHCSVAAAGLHECLTCLAEYEMVSDFKRVQDWRSSGSQALVFTEHIVTAVTGAESDGGVVRIIKPSR